jgi:hypothetical protein
MEYECLSSCGRALIYPSAVTSSKIRPPSGDLRDYFSWAPYRWPDCDACPGDTDEPDDREGADDPEDEDDDDKDAQSAKLVPLRRRAHENVTENASKASAVFNQTASPVVLAKKPTTTTSCPSKTKPKTPQESGSCERLTRQGL